VLPAPDPRRTERRRLPDRANPVEPTEQYCDGARIVAQPMSGTTEDAEFSTAMGGRQLPGVARRHALVIVAVHHQEWARPETACRVDRSKPPECSTPFLK